MVAQRNAPRRGHREPPHPPLRRGRQGARQFSSQAGQGRSRNYIIRELAFSPDGTPLRSRRVIASFMCTNLAQTEGPQVDLRKVRAPQPHHVLLLAIDAAQQCRVWDGGRQCLRGHDQRQQDSQARAVVRELHRVHVGEPRGKRFCVRAPRRARAAVRLQGSAARDKRRAQMLFKAPFAPYCLHGVNIAVAGNTGQVKFYNERQRVADVHVLAAAQQGLRLRFQRAAARSRSFQWRVSTRRGRPS